MVKTRESKRLDIHFSSASSEWETPQHLFDKLNEEFHFTLDVCATKKNAKCRAYFTKKEDGLEQVWTGVCWMNPPYGRTIGKWVQKAYYEHHLGGLTVVCLLPARTDTKWFHGYILGKSEIRFLKGRLKFSNTKNSAPFPSMVVVYRQQKRRYSDDRRRIRTRN